MPPTLPGRRTDCRSAAVSAPPKCVKKSQRSRARSGRLQRLVRRQFAASDQGENRKSLYALYNYFIVVVVIQALLNAREWPMAAAPAQEPEL
jgi:hypothetical protein